MQKLTPELKTQIEATRDRMFEIVKGTKTDRGLAEEAIRPLIIPVMRGYEITWVKNITEARAEHERATNEHKVAVGSMVEQSDFARWFTAAARETVIDHLSSGCIRGQLRHQAYMKLVKTLKAAAAESMNRDVSSMSVSELLSDVLDGKGIEHSINYCLAMGQRLARLSVSGLSEHEIDRLALLGDGVIDCCLDPPHIVPWLAMHETGIFTLTPEQLQTLGHAVAFAEHAFACWGFPGELILLEKPETVTVNDRGEITSIQWSGDPLAT